MWINRDARRFYRARLEQDLFGEWTLRKVWGGVGSRLGGTSLTGVASLKDGLEAVRQLDRRRCRRGYQRVQ
jgi:predicted DNA-binding WGR domain protein